MYAIRSYYVALGLAELAKRHRPGGAFKDQREPQHDVVHQRIAQLGRREPVGDAFIDRDAGASYNFV